MLRPLLLALSFAPFAPAQFSNPELLTTALLDTQSVEFADLDGDGQMELLVASAGANLIGWLTGDGQGHFGNVQTLTTQAAGATLVRAADLDLDGDLDVVGGSALDGSVRVWQNLGGPNIQFGPEVLEANAVMDLSDLDIVDVTGDGYPDILTASPTANRIAVLINNGDGTFQHIKVLVGPNLGAVGVTAMDVDGDGSMDVVGTHKGGNNTNYFRNLGGGNFASGVNFASGSSSAKDVAAFDADGDGDADLFLSGNGLRYFENLGAGAFATGVNLTTSGLGRMRIGDWDGDGDTDIATGSQFGSSGYVYLNQGGGAFAITLFLPTFQSHSLTDVAAADLNGDGVIDWATAQTIEDAPRVYLGIGPNLTDGFSEVTNPVLTMNGATDLAFGDFNEDGLRDLVAGSKLDGNVLHYAGLGGGSFAAPVALIEGEKDLVQVLVADFNGDGHDDVASLRTGQSRVRLVFSNGNGGFSNPFTVLQVGGITQIATGDLDGDGDLDLVAAFGFQDYIDWFRNNGNGNFSLAGSVAGVMDQPVELEVVDLDGDGHVDVLAGGEVASGVRWFKNQGAGAFVGLGQSLSAFSEGARGIEVGDLNADGLLDLVVASKIYGDLRIVMQTSPGVFSEPNLVYSETLSNVDLALSDVTNDGLLDMVVATSFVNEVRVHAGLGNGAFEAPMVISNTLSDYSRVLTGDVDGDGDQDLAFASFGGDNVGVVLNQAAFSDCNSNGVYDVAEIENGTATDLDGNGILDECLAPPLYADGFAIDAATGGAQAFALNAGVAHAGELYVMVGSLSGTAPGTQLGSLVVPINADAYTNLLLTTGVVPLAPKFGVLDGNGQATATLTLPAGTANAYVGQTAHHAFVTFGTDFTFASNAVPVTIE